MLEPSAAVCRRNAEACAACETYERISGARSESANVLLLERPSGLDWIEVRRVRRQVEEADPRDEAGR